MFLDFSMDFTTWDNTQSVTLEYRRRDTTAPNAPKMMPVPNATDRILVAKRRAVNSREKSPSDGVYVGYEARWLIPAALVPNGRQLKPGDVVIDDAEMRWTALTVDLNRHGATWLLGTVNLALALDLRSTVDVEAPTILYDDSGSPVKTWPSGGGQPGGTVLYPAIPANVQLLTEATADERGIRGLKGTVAVTISREIAASTEYRLRLNGIDVHKVGGAYLDIMGYHSPERIDELPVIDCERRPG